ncbi:MAG: peptide chain release factor N(5)-glutamine methyltransferase [Bacteroidetes bacterium]|nr:peptide chain release factor N(5)-glutamine methyltransferase [Bacteroidota bacterium]
MATAEPAKKVWTILDLITWGTGYLTEKNIDDARLTIELLLARVLQLQRIQLYTKFDQPLSETELASFKALLKRRLNREPLQYILGDTEFMGLRILVGPDVLIPRPETELLAERAMILLQQMPATDHPLSILDLGTGCGCIAVALARKFPQAEVTAVDVSAAALTIAASNAALHGLEANIRFIQEDMAALSADRFPRPFHCIISNPPYISAEEYGQVAPEVKDFEPGIALTDNGNGLKFYPTIAHLAAGALAPNGFVAVEHAFDQSTAVREIFADHGFTDAEVIKDYAGIERHAVFRKR